MGKDDASPMSIPTSPRDDASNLTSDELARLHPRTDLAVLRQLLGLFVPFTDDIRFHFRKTLLGIAERGPLPPALTAPAPAHHIVGLTKRLAFVTVPHESYIFLSSDEEVSRLFERLFVADDT